MNLKNGDQSQTNLFIKFRLPKYLQTDFKQMLIQFLTHYKAVVLDKQK